MWYQTIDKFFADMGCKRVEGRYGLYVIWNDDVKCIIALYVDDLLLACSSLVFMGKLKAALQNEYEIKDWERQSSCWVSRLSVTGLTV